MYFTPVCRIWLHELLLPVYACAVSVVILGVQSILAALKPSAYDDVDLQNMRLTPAERFKRHLEGAGGRVIFTFRLARLVTLAALVGLCIFTVLDERYVGEEQAAWLQIGLLGTYVSLRHTARLSC